MACELYFNKAEVFKKIILEAPNKMLRRKMNTSPLELFQVLTFFKVFI